MEPGHAIMRSFFTYTAARFLLFAVAFGVVYLLGARSYLALAIALVVSALASYVLLSPQRDAMSSQVVRWYTGLRDISRRLDEGSRREDEEQERDTTATAPRHDGTDRERDSTRESAEPGRETDGETATHDDEDTPEDPHPDREDTPTGTRREHTSG